MYFKKIQFVQDARRLIASSVTAVNGNLDAASEISDQLRACPFMQLRGDSENGVLFIYEVDASGENINRRRLGFCSADAES